ncbi:MAG: DUF3828 domain-containing protein [Hyphomonadaceae bacterium]|nr:DUF3828 domain-containing protein [Hyphomonadaceae bacterium]
MFKLKGLVALTAIALLSACGEPADGPAAFVRGVYAPYIAGGAEKAGLQSPDNLTAGLRAFIARADAYSRLIEEPVIDHDPITNAQDWEIKAVKVAVTRQPKDGEATVDATFDNFGKATTVTFTLREEDGGWKIDDLASDGASFRAGVEANLKPAGDAAAMEAPVRAIYARYAAEPKPEPLHRWVAFSAGLRPLMERQSAMGRRADTPVIDFEPPLDSKSNQLGTVSYDVVSSAVIARFQNGAEQKIVVYDLTQEDGAWKIANIRAPGGWDLLQKLAEAGVKE